MTNVLLLVPGFPCNEDDTTCIPALQTLIKQLNIRAGSEYKFTVISFQYPFNKGEYKWNGISCYSAGGMNTKFPGRLITWLRVFRFLKKLNKEKKVDIIHSFWLTECALLGMLTGKLYGARYIAHIMGQDVLLANSYMKMLKWFKMEIIANSEFSASVIKNNFGVEVMNVIPFGIDETEYVNTIESYDRNIHLLGVGSLTTIKNYALFLTIFFELRKEFPKLTAEIIGEGPEYGNLQQLIDQHDASNFIRLNGKLNHAEVLQKMSKSKILLHTAAFESAGYVFLEALRSGMKVVSFETGYLPQIPGAYQCSDVDKMLLTIKSLLTYRQEYIPQTVPLISDTADQIINLYKNRTAQSTSQFI
jgi:1,2-diacylglycerol 3-alpha-glucosyltransferase